MDEASTPTNLEMINKLKEFTEFAAHTGDERYMDIAHRLSKNVLLTIAKEEMGNFKGEHLCESAAKGICCELKSAAAEDPLAGKAKKRSKTMSSDRIYLCRFLQYKSDHEDCAFVVLADSLDEANRKAFIDVAQEPSFWDGRTSGLPDSLAPGLQKLIPERYRDKGLEYVDSIRLGDMREFLGNLQEDQMAELIDNFHCEYPENFSVRQAEVLE